MNEENRSALDRELFSELIESPIHPLLINMVRPYVEKKAVLPADIKASKCWYEDQEKEM